MKYNSIDLFSGCGGLTYGMKKSGFKVISAVDINNSANNTYKLNHPEVNLFEVDIRKLSGKKLMGKSKTVHFLAGCPPCQGFSSVRRLNKKRTKRDKRNDLLMEFLRIVSEIKPLSIMMENVPGIVNYYLFNKFIKSLVELGYYGVENYKILNFKNFGVPQQRKRFTLVGSLLGPIEVLKTSNETSSVYDAIGNMESVTVTKDPIHKIYPTHKPEIVEMISHIPLNGGSRSDLPKKYILDCHKKNNIGFHDIYGRLKWEEFSSTITGGCLNPSKGRFLHPEESRCITAREASLLQTFPKKYKFPKDIFKGEIAQMIGNALPPHFAYHQTLHIKKHLEEYLV